MIDGKRNTWPGHAWSLPYERLVWLLADTYNHGDFGC